MIYSLGLFQSIHNPFWLTDAYLHLRHLALSSTHDRIVVAAIATISKRDEALSSDEAMKMMKAALEQKRGLLVAALVSVRIYKSRKVYK